MSSLAWQCSRLVCLLAVLWAVGRGEANQPQPSAGVGTNLGPDQLLRLIVQDVTANIQPLITKLASRIDGLDTRLTGLDIRLNGIETGLNSLRSKQDSFDAKLDGLDSRVDSLDNTFNARLDELNSVVGGVGSRLDELAANMDSADRLIDSRLDELISRANSTEGSLGELASEVDSADKRLEARLNELASEVDSADNRLEARLDEMVSRVNSTGGSLGSRLNEVVSRVDRLAAERDGHLNNVSSHLDDLSSRLDTLANLTDPRLQPPRDCSGLPAGSRSGIHRLQPDLDRSRPPVMAYCDLDTDGGRWTVIQRRADVQPRQNFNLGWSAYREGFGDLEAEFWWGLENLWRLTGSPQHRQFELRVNLADFDGQRRYASYGNFTVASEADEYRLSVGDYTGNAGDSLDNHSGKRFSTIDRDHDSWGGHCAQEYEAGWWFGHCQLVNLNGPYLHGQQTRSEGVTWGHWRGGKYSLKETEMKVRPVNTD